MDDLFSVKFKKPPREYAKGYMFEVRVADRSGEMTLKYWGTPDLDGVTRVYHSFGHGDVIRVRGRISSFRDVLEIAVSGEETEAIVPVPAEAYDIRDFVGVSGKDIDQMMSRLNSFIRKVEEPHLRKLLQHFFADEAFVERFKAAPASMHLHCNWIGGLLEHTLNVVETSDFLADRHKEMERDLLITGAILHDIGKLEEYVVSTNIDVSVDGMLRGHIIIGAEMVVRACDSIDGFPEVLKLKLAHMVLSSHGRIEQGAAKEPQFAEAVAIAFADDMDAKLEQYIRAKEEARTEDLWIWDRRLKHVFLL